MSRLAVFVRILFPEALSLVDNLLCFASVKAYSSMTQRFDKVSELHRNTLKTYQKSGNSPRNPFVEYSPANLSGMSLASWLSVGGNFEKIMPLEYLYTV